MNFVFIGRFRVFVGLVLGFCLFSTSALEGAMQNLVFQLDGRVVDLEPGPRVGDNGVMVPLYTFSEAVGAEAKKLDGDGPLAVCRDDLCIPLNTGNQQTVEIDGTLYAPLDAFGEPLGLGWKVVVDTLQVTRSVNEGQAQVGLAIGDVPPPFTLPDLYTGEPVAMGGYRGKKTVFYMWASW